MEGWHPVAAAGLGALLLFGIAGFVLVLLLWFDNPKVDPSWALPVFATAIAAGGAAGLTMKNLNLKRAESRRDTNLMFDSQFETGARLLGGDSESEIIAGSLLLGSLLRESPRHAQACADLLCASLRKKLPGDLEPDEEDSLIAQDPPGMREAMAEATRIRNSITRAVAHGLRKADGPAHLATLRWRFDDAVFGDEVDFETCIFGPGTRFARAVFSGDVSFWGASFGDSVRFSDVYAPRGLFMRGVKVSGAVEVENGRFGKPGQEGSYGVFLMGAHIKGLWIEHLVTAGDIDYDGGEAIGDIEIAHVQCRSVFVNGVRCHGRVELHSVDSLGDFGLKDLTIRKTLDVNNCKGRALEIRNVAAEGGVSHADNQFETEVHE